MALQLGCWPVSAWLGTHRSEEESLLLSPLEGWWICAPPLGASAVLQVLSEALPAHAMSKHRGAVACRQRLISASSYALDRRRLEILGVQSQACLQAVERTTAGAGCPTEHLLAVARGCSVSEEAQAASRRLCCLHSSLGTQDQQGPSPVLLTQMAADRLGRRRVLARGAVLKRSNLHLILLHIQPADSQLGQHSAVQLSMPQLQRSHPGFRHM